MDSMINYYVKALKITEQQVIVGEAIDVKKKHKKALSEIVELDNVITSLSEKLASIAESEETEFRLANKIDAEANDMSLSEYGFRLSSKYRSLETIYFKNIDRMRSKILKLYVLQKQNRELINTMVDRGWMDTSEERVLIPHDLMVELDFYEYGV